LWRSHLYSDGTSSSSSSSPSPTRPSSTSKLLSLSSHPATFKSKQWDSQARFNPQAEQHHHHKHQAAHTANHLPSKATDSLRSQAPALAAVLHIQQEDNRDLLQDKDTVSRLLRIKETSRRDMLLINLLPTHSLLVDRRLSRDSMGSKLNKDNLVSLNRDMASLLSSRVSTVSSKEDTANSRATDSLNMANTDNNLHKASMDSSHRRDSTVSKLLAVSKPLALQQVHLPLIAQAALRRAKTCNALFVKINSSRSTKALSSNRLCNALNVLISAS
jgi:hypothetical protein